jgi:hypothetical protein
MIKLREIFANDTFVNGGQLVDTEFWFAGRDKVQHIICAILLMLLLPFSLLINALILFIGGVCLEVVEYTRFKKFGYTRLFCDKISWRDIVANSVGISLGILLRVIN